MYRSDYESFTSNPVWKEMVETLTEVKAGLNKDLAEYDPITQTTQLARAQGRLALIDFVMELPEDILREIKENEETNTGGRKDG